MTGKEEFGVVEGVSLSGYEIESAISSTAEATKGTDGLTALILNDHLKELCDMQREYLKLLMEESCDTKKDEVRVNYNAMDSIAPNIVGR